nr:GIY-YIG nuclease family protein [Dongia deserti]
MTNKPFGTLYVGMTNDLVFRAYQHRQGLFEGFTKRYGLKMLVYYEEHASAPEAIRREKNIKHWPRAWKIELVRKMNPGWRDLFDEIALQ